MSRACHMYTYNKQKIFSFSVDHFVLTNSVDPDAMSHYAEFHLGLHCLQKYALMSHQYTEV